MPIRLFCAWLLVSIHIVFGSPGHNPQIDSSLNLLMRQDYAGATQVLRDVLASDPDNIDALYYLVTIKQTELMDYESYTINAHPFFDLSDSVRTLLLKKPCTDSVRCLFYLGNIIGGRSVILAKNGNWGKAVQEALASVSLLNRVLLMDSTFLPAYLGLGIFHYYLSQNTKWVPFMNDRTQEGIAQIERALAAPPPFDAAARNSYAWILLERGQPDRAEALVNEVLATVPDNTIFLRIKARIAFSKEDWPTAITLGRLLSDLSMQRVPVNWSDYLAGRQLCVAGYEKSGDWKTSLAVAREALNVKLPGYAKRLVYVKKHLTYLKSIVRKYDRQSRSSR
jgi:tetratricopeptide (TPR) repeat protein